MTLGSSHRCSYLPNEFVHTRGVLDALAQLDTPAYIHGERPNLGDCLPNVPRRQASRENEWFGEVCGNQRPVEYLARPSGNASNEGIEQNGAGPGIASGLGANIVPRLDSQGLVPAAMEPLAIGGLLVAMKLKRIQRYGIEYFVEFAARRVDEQTNRRDEWRQGSDDGAGLLNAHRPRTFAVEHQADRVCPGVGRNKRVLDPRDSTNLATNDRQRQAPATEDPGW